MPRKFRFVVWLAGICLLCFFEVKPQIFINIFTQQRNYSIERLTQPPRIDSKIHGTPRSFHIHFQFDDTAGRRQPYNWRELSGRLRYSRPGGQCRHILVHNNAMHSQVYMYIISNENYTRDFDLLKLSMVGAKAGFVPSDEIQQPSLTLLWPPSPNKCQSTINIRKRGEE